MNYPSSAMAGCGRACGLRILGRVAANNVEIACTPTNNSWLNRIEAQFAALRYFALGGPDLPSHKAQGSMIRRYIIWRNKHPLTSASARSWPR